jgi:MoaA/NifB/PqqE/SkfB family radical SAM enzyme
MKCDHCCFSCNRNGKHGDYSRIIDSLAFAREYGNDSITIGGGEPTLHPRFFNILKHALNDFDYVWMATNGSKTKTMRRLAGIIDGNDWENVECTCSEEDREQGYCDCYDSDDIISQENKLTVALSQDCFHDPIDAAISKLWHGRSAKNHGYEIRNVTHSHDGIAGQGRAKRNGYSGDHCVCSNIIIKPDGKLKLCGCTKAPVIGDVNRGIMPEWQDYIDNDGSYRETNCWSTGLRFEEKKSLARKRKRKRKRVSRDTTLNTRPSMRLSGS